MNLSGHLNNLKSLHLRNPSKWVMVFQFQTTSVFSYDCSIFSQQQKMLYNLQSGKLPANSTLKLFHTIGQCTHYQTNEEWDGDHDDELVAGHQLEVVHGLLTEVGRHHAMEVTCDDE